MDGPIPSGIDIDAPERENDSAWSWFVAIGVVLLALGMLAFLILKLPSWTTVTLHAVGALMLIGAFAQLGTPLLRPDRTGTSPLLLSAFLYGMAGVFLIVNPLLASNALTLMLAFALIFSGVMRIWLSGVMRSLRGWGWITASGFVTVAAGVAFMHLLPVDPVGLLGVVLAFDLTFEGAMAIAFGLSLKASTS